MSFLKGFADVVDKRLEEKRNQKRRREDYEYQANFQEFMLNQRKAREEEIRVGKNKRAADHIAKKTGQADSRAVAIATDMLNSGHYTAQEVEEYFRSGSFDFGPSSPSTPSPAKSASIDQEMQKAGLTESGMTPYQEQVSTPEAILAGQKRERSINEVAEKTGRDKQEVREVVTGSTAPNLSNALKYSFRPNGMADAKWKNKIEITDPDKVKMEIARQASMGRHDRVSWLTKMQDVLANDKMIPDSEGYWVSATETGVERVRAKVKDNKVYRHIDGKWEDTGVPTGVLTGTMISFDTGLSSPEQGRIISGLDAVNEKRMAVNSLLNNTIRASNIVDKNPLTATKAAEIALTIESASRNVLGALEIAYTNFTGQEREDAIAKAESEFTEVLMLNPEIDKITGTRDLMRLKLDMVYDILRERGEEGRSVSNQDIQRTLRTVFTTNPADFKRYMLADIRNRVKNVDASLKTFAESHGDILTKSRDHHMYLTMNGVESILALSYDEDDSKARQAVLEEAMNLKQDGLSDEMLSGKPKDYTSSPITEEIWQSLPKGTRYMAPNGKLYIRE